VAGAGGEERPLVCFGNNPDVDGGSGGRGYSNRMYTPVSAWMNTAIAEYRSASPPPTLWRPRAPHVTVCVVGCLWAMHQGTSAAQDIRTMEAPPTPRDVPWGANGPSRCASGKEPSSPTAGCAPFASRRKEVMEQMGCPQHTLPVDVRERI